jgi:hypothetical protein
MPRAIQITLPPQKTEQIVSEIKKVHGLIGLRVQHGISLHPPGDVISIEVVTRSMPFMIDLLANHDIGIGSDSSNDNKRSPLRYFKCKFVRNSK